MKVEKDYWMKNEEKKSKRITWAKAKDSKDKELVDANRKILQLK